MSTTERTVTSADGTAIFADAAGDPSKPAVVFVHGLSCDTLGWDSQFKDPELVRTLYLVRYDMRGHGRSAQPTEAKDYESIRLAEDFKAVCDGFGVKKPFIAGWSIGGSIVVDVVAAYGGSYLSGVLYIGGAVLSLHERYLPKCVTPLIGELIPLLHSTDPDDISRASRIFVDSCTVPGKLTHQQKLQSLGTFVTQSRTSRTLHLSRTQPCEAWERQAADLPVLVIQGTEDQHCLYENMIQLAKGVYKDVEVRLIEGVGHSPSLEAPGETNKFILEWVTKIAARQAQA